MEVRAAATEESAVARRFFEVSGSFRVCDERSGQIALARPGLILRRDSRGREGALPRSCELPFISEYLCATADSSATTTEISIYFEKAAVGERRAWARGRGMAARLGGGRRGRAWAEGRRRTPCLGEGAREGGAPGREAGVFFAPEHKPLFLDAARAQSNNLGCCSAVGRKTRCCSALRPFWSENAEQNRKFGA